MSGGNEFELVFPFSSDNELHLTLRKAVTRREFECIKNLIELLEETVVIEEGGSKPEFQGSAADGHFQGRHL